MNELQGGRIHISGIVQGVGFRPFVYTLAARLGLTGWVRNTSAGVEIEVDGDPTKVEMFIRSLREEAPPLAIIDELTFFPTPPKGFSNFEIVHSQPLEGAFQPISPDVCVCADCLDEFRISSNRRFHYPFTNCTNCGPRFSIITDIPYDRQNTTMISFQLCPDCAAEYSNPMDRRFHAQPVACPVCGPKVWIEPEMISDENSILVIQRLLLEGRIIAIKGLGGFHLACDALNPEAVSLLRQRKLRVSKPFALMMRDLGTVEEHCFLSKAEGDLIESRERPVVILQRKPGSSISREIAPRQETLGIMLPYTPLHYMLFEPIDPNRVEPAGALVMTSGNLSEEPIATDNEEARTRLAGLADVFLMHNRPIRNRCDDSVVKVVTLAKDKVAEDINVGHREVIQYYRRSRGYAPAPISLPWETPIILAAGAELKNTFCFTRDRYAFLSHHIGDMQNYETFQSFQDGVEQFERLFHLKPEAIAYDLHPDYLATRYALERAERENLPSMGVQHHHAHIAACMADNGLLPGQVVIGVSFDGTGFGVDGAIWGGEFLLASYAASPEHDISQEGFRRLSHLSYIPLPGGDAAIRVPARTALAHLWKVGIEWETIFPSTEALCAEDRLILRAQLEHNLNTPLTSSMGRLFDAVASLAGVCQKVNYEAQAAIELEAMADPGEMGEYQFDFQSTAKSCEYFTIDPAPLLHNVVDDLYQGCPASIISARFHNGCARMVVDVCQLLRAETGVGDVALSGGVWQNALLLKKTVANLERNDFRVFIPRRIPTNDGGLSLGQAVIAAQRLCL